MLEVCRRSMYVSPRALLNRNFAMIDMMRKLDVNCTPDDLVFIYLHDTSCHSWDPANLTSKYDTAEERYLRVSTLDHVDKVAATRNRASIPTAIKKMANDYLRRCFWNHITSCLDYYKAGCFEQNARQYSSRTSNVYPAYVRNALDQITISDFADMMQMQPQLDAFSAAVNRIHFSSNARDSRSARPCWLSTVPDDYHESPDNWTTLTQNQLYNLERIIKCLERFVWQSNNNPIPVVLKDTFFNLLTSIMLLKYHSFIEARRSLIISEISKQNLTEIGKSVRIGNPEYVRYCNDGEQFGYFFDGRVDNANEALRHLTPQAACCIGRFASFRRLINGDTISTSEFAYRKPSDPTMVTVISRQINPTAIPEVARYMATELYVERCKLIFYARNHKELDNPCNRANDEHNDGYETMRFTLDDIQKASKMSEWSIIAHPEKASSTPVVALDPPVECSLTRR